MSTHLPRARLYLSRPVYAQLPDWELRTAGLGASLWV